MYTSSRSATGSTRGAIARTRAQRVVLLGGAGEAQLHDLTRRVRGDQRARRALGDDLPAVHDHEPVAELLGLVHVVRREHERDAVSA